MNDIQKFENYGGEMCDTSDSHVHMWDSCRWCKYKHVKKLGNDWCCRKDEKCTAKQTVHTNKSGAVVFKLKKDQICDTRSSHKGKSDSCQRCPTPNKTYRPFLSLNDYCS